MVYQIDLYCILTDIYLLNYEEDPKEQVNIPCFDYCDYFVIVAILAMLNCEGIPLMNQFY